MGFFDFLPEIDRYSEDPGTVARMNARHKMVIKPLAEEIAGKRVLDLAAHDGRWAYAFAAAGAAEVVGIEGRQSLIDRFAEFPREHLKKKVSLKCGDLFAGMQAEIEAGQRYDVVGVLGILYHVMDHMRLFDLVRQLGPKLVVVDSEFLDRPGAVIALQRERTHKDLNAIAQFEGQEVTAIGIPSRKAMELIAEVQGFDIDWLDWEGLPVAQREHVGDYYRKGEKRRYSCLLRPKTV
ncbi:methyltransferase domain-containing protein [Thioclava sp. GXIMD4216]|uniref:Methyltransferase domain-containing protein n=1 Tax=Thioclava litoralis TaxID=3076557 RepID=A0ABZ1E1E6_9RHOB|nr:methyltransferase domain-containing protein [Thioclava sp. FTW29]